MPNNKSILNHSLFPITIVIVLGALLRFILAILSMPSGDSCWHLNVGRYIAQSGTLPVHEWLGRYIFVRSPLFHLIAAAFYAFFSLFGGAVAETGIRLVSAFFGSISLVLFYLVAKTLFDEKIAFYGTIFMAIIPLHLYYSTISHIDILISFLVLLGIWLILLNRIFLSALVLGMIILSKESGIFVVPLFLLLVFYKMKDKKEFLRKSSYFILSLVIGSLWYIRNWILFKNPFCPFLNELFGSSCIEIPGSVGSVASGFGLSKILEIPHALFTFYLGLFGVPDGNFAGFFFFNIPFLYPLMVIWFIATIVFIVPLFIGIFKANHNEFRVRFLFVWFLLFFAVSLLFVLISSFYSRILLPAIPVLALFWAQGFVQIPLKYKKMAVFLLAGFVLMFCLGESVKTVLAAKTWNSYTDDYNWARINTAQTDIFYVPGQCFSYYLHREVYPSAYDQQAYFEILNNPNKLKYIDYVWVNPTFVPAQESRTPLGVEEILMNLNMILVYSNKDTKIYHNPRNRTSP